MLFRCLRRQTLLLSSSLPRYKYYSHHSLAYELSEARRYLSAELSPSLGAAPEPPLGPQMATVPSTRSAYPLSIKVKVPDILTNTANTLCASSSPVHRIHTPMHTPLYILSGKGMIVLVSLIVLQRERFVSTITPPYILSGKGFTHDCAGILDSIAKGTFFTHVYNNTPSLSLPPSPLLFPHR